MIPCHTTNSARAFCADPGTRDVTLRCGRGYHADYSVRWPQAGLPYQRIRLPKRHVIPTTPRPDEAAMQIEPFEIAIPDQDIDDLRQRIRATRWAPATPSPAWQQGIDRRLAARTRRLLGRAFRLARGRAQVEPATAVPRRGRGAARAFRPSAGRGDCRLIRSSSRMAGRARFSSSTRCSTSSAIRLRSAPIPPMRSMSSCRRCRASHSRRRRRRAAPRHFRWRTCGSR